MIKLRLTRRELHAWQTVLWVSAFTLWVACTYAIVEWWANNLVNLGIFTAAVRITVVVVWWLLTIVFVWYERTHERN